MGLPRRSSRRSPGHSNLSGASSGLSVSEQSNASTLSTLGLGGLSPILRKRLSHFVNGKVHGSPLAADQSIEEDEEQDAASRTIENMRCWRNDAMAQHLYSTADFWGSKVFTKSNDPNDAFWLAQIYFLTHQYARSEGLLTKPRPAPLQDTTNIDEPVASTSKGVIRRLVDVSVACRYLAAQCMVRQAKWQDALDLLGDVNPFRGTTSSGPTVPVNDGGIKVYFGILSFEKHLQGVQFEASLCHLRGLIHLHLNATDSAKDSFLEALSLDVKCFEAFEALVNGNMLKAEEEWNFVQSLAYREQTAEDAELVRMMYSIRLKKVRPPGLLIGAGTTTFTQYQHQDEIELCRRALAREHGLEDDPDVLFALADRLFAGHHWADCYAITSRILERHEGHGPSLPLHLACMHHLPNLRPSLFLLAHDLVERALDDAVSWYAVGLWYYSGKRWDEARRFLGKAVLLDSRFGPAWIAFAHCYALEGEHDQAITAYSTAQRHFPGLHLPMLFIGMQHLQLSNLSLADEYLKAAWSICSDDPLLANELGVAAYHNDDMPRAIEFLETSLKLAKAVQCSPSVWAPTRCNLGHAYRVQGRYQEAMSCFRESINLDARVGSPHAGLGFVLLALKEREAAIDSLHEALARTPADPVCSELLRLALEDAAMHGPDKDGTDVTYFPGLSSKTIEDLDRDVAEMFGKILAAPEPGHSANGVADDSQYESMQVEEDTSL